MREPADIAGKMAHGAVLTALVVHFFAWIAVKTSIRYTPFIVCSDGQGNTSRTLGCYIQVWYSTWDTKVCLVHAQTAMLENSQQQTPQWQGITVAGNR